MTKNFDDGIKRVHKNLLNSVKGFADINGAVSIAKDLFNVGAQAVAAFAGEIDRLDDIVDTAKRLDVTADALQRFRRAAELTSGSVEGIDKALSIFQRNLGDAGMGASGPNKALGILGLDAKSLQDIGLEKAFETVLLKLEQIPDATKRASVGADLFGKAASDLTDLMGNSSSAIAQATADVNQFGSSLNSRADDIGKAKDAMDRLKMSTQALGTELTLAFAPFAAGAATVMARDFSAVKNADWMKILVEGGMAGLVSPGMQADIVKRELALGLARSILPPSMPKPTGLLDKYGRPEISPQALGQTDALNSEMLDAYRFAKANFRSATPSPQLPSGYALPNLVTARYAASDLLAGFRDSDPAMRSVSAGTSAIEYGSAAAYTALQQSRREEEGMRLQKQEVEETKKQTKAIESLEKTVQTMTLIDTLGIQG